MRPPLEIPGATRGEVVILGDAGEDVRVGRLVRLVVDVHPGERPAVGELVLDLERVHVGQVDRPRRVGDVLLTIFLARVVGRAADRLGRPVGGHILGRRAQRRVAGRDDRAGEQAAGGHRTAAGRGAPRIGAFTAVRVPDLNRGAADGRLREVADALVGAGPDLLLEPRGEGAIAFHRIPPEGAVLDDRAATAAAIQTVVGVSHAAALRCAAGFRGEVVEGLPPDRTGLEEAAAVELVGADAAGRVEHAATGPPHLGVVGVNLDLDVGEGLDRRIEHRAVVQLGNRDTVEEVVVATDGAAAQRDTRGVGLILLAVELRVANRRHRRDGDRNEEGVAARGRQRLEDLAVERVTDRGVGRLDEWRVGRYRDLLFNRADFQDQVDGQSGLGADRDPALLVGLVPRERRADRVGSRSDGGKRVLADLVGDGVTGNSRALVHQGDSHARDDPLGVTDRATHVPRKLLTHRISGPGKHQKRTEHEQ